MACVFVSKMKMDTPDQTLAEAAANGDRAAFAALISRHYDRVFGLCWRLTGSKADAEDLTQDIQSMQRLSSELRDTVALVLGEELTQAEAAQVLGLSEGTVAWRMSEVKKRLRAMAAEEAKL